VRAIWPSPLLLSFCLREAVCCIGYVPSITRVTVPPHRPFPPADSSRLQGAWRRIAVDDTIPVDEEGRFLFPRSSLPELWPLLVAKAVCRVLEPYYEVRLDLPEFGQASVLQLLTGWLPETRALDLALPDTMRRDASSAATGALGLAAPSAYPTVTDEDEAEEEIPLTPLPDAIHVTEHGAESPPPSAPPTPASLAERSTALALPHLSDAQQDSPWQRTLTTPGSLEGLPSPRNSPALAASHTHATQLASEPMHDGRPVPLRQTSTSSSLAPSRQQSLFGTASMPPLPMQSSQRAPSVIGPPPALNTFHPSERDKTNEAEAALFGGLEFLLQQLKSLCFAPSSSPSISSDSPSSISPPATAHRSPAPSTPPDRDALRAEARTLERERELKEKSERFDKPPERERAPPASAARRAAGGEEGKRRGAGASPSTASARPKTTLSISLATDS
jgi:hypothetical protein